MFPSFPIHSRIEEYQIRFDLKTIELAVIQTNIDNNQYGWNHPAFDLVRNQIEQEIYNIENPFEIEEGALMCFKCKSKRVLSFSKQVRSSDEPMTTFSKCSKCGHKWTSQ